MPYRLSGLVAFRSALFALAVLSPAACGLTEEVRTRPGAPGEVPTFGNGGNLASGGSSGLDGGGSDADVDGAHVGSGGRGDSGTGGRSGAGGGSGVDGGGAPADGGFEPRECPVDITFACHDYCGALSLVTDCREKLRRSAGVKEDGGAYFPDGSVPHELSVVEQIVRCKCDCELRYRTQACSYDFDQFVMCGKPPLTVVCATDPDFIDGVPSVIGDGCASLRASFVRCLETPPPPPPDGGPS